MQKMYVANKAFLVNSEGRILLVRDAGTGDHANSKGKWDVPGGRMEQGELPLDALVRELREEIGFDMDQSAAKPFHVGKWGVGGDMLNEPIIGIFWEVPANPEAIKLSDEHMECAWMDLDEATDALKGRVVEGAIARYRRFCQKA